MPPDALVRIFSHDKKIKTPTQKRKACSNLVFYFRKSASSTDTLRMRQVGNEFSPTSSYSEDNYIRDIQELKWNFTDEVTEFTKIEIVQEFLQR